MRNTMLTLPTNSTNFIGRIFFLLLTFFLFYLFLNFGVKDPKGEHIVFAITLLHFEFRVKYIMYFLVCAVAYLAVLLVVSLLGVNKVQVDTVNDTIKLSSLFTSKTFPTAEISEYSQTIHRNTAKAFFGLLLKFSDGKKIQVVGQNVQRISDLKDYLIERRVPQGIGQKMKFPFN